LISGKARMVARTLLARAGGVWAVVEISTSRRGVDNLRLVGYILG
jgi:hypothetical protein